MCILNNLGTALNATGRIIDAIEIWDRLLLIDDSFALARLNRALAWIYYGDAVHDESHRLLLRKRAYQNMKQISRPVLTAEQRDDLDRHLKSLEATVGLEWLDEEINWDDMRISDTAEEKTYREWCLKNRLFLHPLNDAGNILLASYDAIATPDMFVEYIADGPYRQGFFNQLVQEFVSARFLIYEGFTFRPTHFSDRHVTLADTLDGALFSFGQEKIRCAFRVTYSLFDKIAYFLNHYFHLDIPEKQVSFRSLWYEKRNLKTRPVRSEFKTRYSNWPLRALFWLSKDFEEDNDGFQNSIEPEAQKLRSIRDHLEHKLLRIHRESVPEIIPLGQYSITESDFRSKTIRLARLGRSALMYLALAMRHEERSNRNTAQPTVPLAWVPLHPNRK